MSTWRACSPRRTTRPWTPPPVAVAAAGLSKLAVHFRHLSGVPEPHQRRLAAGHFIHGSTTPPCGLSSGLMCQAENAARRERRLRFRLWGLSRRSCSGCCRPGPAAGLRRARLPRRLPAVRAVVAPSFGVEVSYHPVAAFADPELLRGGDAGLSGKTRPVVTFETVRSRQGLPPTPQRHGALTVIDNSWATPVFQQPLALGIDLVLHSASKYISGHSDTVAGVVSGRAEPMAKITDSECAAAGRQTGAVRRLAADPRVGALWTRGWRVSSGHGRAVRRTAERSPAGAPGQRPRPRQCARACAGVPGCLVGGALPPRSTWRGCATP